MNEAVAMGQGGGVKWTGAVGAAEGQNHDPGGSVVQEEEHWVPAPSLTDTRQVDSW